MAVGPPNAGESIPRHARLIMVNHLLMFDAHLPASHIMPTAYMYINFWPQYLPKYYTVWLHLLMMYVEEMSVQIRREILTDR